MRLDSFRFLPSLPALDGGGGFVISQQFQIVIIMICRRIERRELDSRVARCRINVNFDSTLSYWLGLLGRKRVFRTNSINRSITYED